MIQLKKLLAKKTVVMGLILVFGLGLIGAASSLLAEKESGKGYLGVYAEKVSKDDKEEFGVTFGVLVTRVVKDEAADKAGIKKYDVIQYVNDEKIRRTVDLVDAVRDHISGTNIKIKLVRDGKEKELTATLGELKLKALDFKRHDKDKKGYFFVSGNAYLGVYLHELNKDLAEYFGMKEDEGALILKVAKDTPAEKAGIKAGDVIVKFNDKNISKARDVNEILSDLEKGDKVDIELIRHKKKMTVKAELDEREGYEGIKILKRYGKDFDIDIPNMHFQMPGSLYCCPDDNEHNIILKKETREKINEKLKKVDEKIHRVHEKLKHVNFDEDNYI